MKIIEITDDMPVPIIIESSDSNLYQHIAFIEVEELASENIYKRRHDEISVDVFGTIKINVLRPFNGRVLIIQRI